MIVFKRPIIRERQIPKLAAALWTWTSHTKAHQYHSHIFDSNI